MGPGATHLAFAAALACFVVSVAGLVTVRRRTLVGSADEVRILAAVAFAVVGAASVVWGALVVPEEPAPILGLVRMIGLAAAVASVRNWLVPGWLRALVGLGLMAILAGDAVALAGRPALGAGIGLAGAAVAAVGLGRVSVRSVTTSVPVLGAVLGVGAVMVAATGLGRELSGSFTEHRDLGRLLFLVGASAVAVAGIAASLVADRLARDLDLLTEAAAGIRAGSVDARVRIRSDDELGLLGEAFTSMASSVRAVSGELQATAADEIALRNRLQAVVDGMSEAVLAVGPDGSVSEANPAAAALFELDRDRLVGRLVSDVVRWRLADGRSTPIAAADLADGPTMTVDLVVGETSVPVVVSAGALRPVPSPGPGVDEVPARLSPAGMVLLFRDVRRERQVEDLKAAILANIGHELRTPLTPIKGYAAMLRDRDVEEARTRRFADEIVDGVDQLERVVDQLVTFATIAAGRLTLTRAAVALPDLVDGLRSRWSPRLGPQHSLMIEVLSRSRDEGDGGDASGPVGESSTVLFIDRPLLDRALDELVDNAVKFSPDGGTVTVTVSTDSAGTEFRVLDRGVGMTAEVLDALGDDFAQADGSSTRAFDGLGLGIACADRIIRAHGGGLKISSAPGAGTTVRVVVPHSAGVEEGPSTS